MSDPTMTVVHPSDPRNDGKPFAVTLRKPSNAEAAEREEKNADEEVAYAVLHPVTKEPIPGAYVWSRSGSRSETKGLREFIQFRFVSADNPPDGKPVTKDDVSALLDDRFNIPRENSNGFWSFAFYCFLEYQKYVWPTPTVPTSAPSS